MHSPSTVLVNAGPCTAAPVTSPLGANVTETRTVPVGPPSTWHPLALSAACARACWTTGSSTDDFPEPVKTPLGSGSSVSTGCSTTDPAGGARRDAAVAGAAFLDGRAGVPAEGARPWCAGVDSAGDVLG